MDSGPVSEYGACFRRNEGIGLLVVPLLRCLRAATAPSSPDQRRVLAAPEGVVFQGGEVFLAPDPAADFFVGGYGGS